MRAYASNSCEQNRASLKFLEAKMKKFRKKVFQRIQSNWPKKNERIEVVNDPIGMAAYGMDSHNVRRYVNNLGFVENEGNVEAHVK